jgi:hypothetical protein
MADLMFGIRVHLLIVLQIKLSPERRIRLRRSATGIITYTETKCKHYFAFFSTFSEVFSALFPFAGEMPEEDREHVMQEAFFRVPARRS